MPIALVFFETIKSNAVLNGQIDSVNRISSAAWCDFAKAVQELCTDERQDALQNPGDDTSLIGQVTVEHDLIIKRLVDTRSRILKDLKDRSLLSTEVRELQEFIKQHRKPLSDKFEAVKQQVGTRSSLEGPWARMLPLWEALDAHVRLRRLELGLKWMDETHYLDLRNSITRPDNPIFEFTKVNDESGLGRLPRSICDILGHLERLEDRNEDEVAAILVKLEKFFDVGVPFYGFRALEARSFLRLLRNSVEAVTGAGWPEKFTKPEQEPNEFMIDAEPRATEGAGNRATRLVTSACIRYESGR